MRDRRIHQKCAISKPQKTGYRDHHMPSEKERNMPIVDVLIVFVGALAIMGGILMLAGWMLDSNSQSLDERTGQRLESIEHQVTSANIDMSVLRTPIHIS